MKIFEESYKDHHLRVIEGEDDVGMPEFRGYLDGILVVGSVDYANDEEEDEFLKYENQAEVFEELHRIVDRLEAGGSTP